MPSKDNQRKQLPDFWSHFSLICLDIQLVQIEDYCVTLLSLIALYTKMCSRSSS